MDPASTRVFQEVRIENTNRCGFRCQFCPREAMTRQQGVMSLGDLELVLRRVGSHDGRVDLHGFGEPLLDPLLLQKTELVSRTWPSASPTIYSTLGVPVEENFFERLIDAGLAELQVSFYGSDPATYRRVHGVQHHALAWSNLLSVRKAARDRPRFRLILRDHPVSDALPRDDAETSSLQGLLQDLQASGAAVVRQRPLHNFAGGRHYNSAGSGTPCSVVGGFRSRVLQVTWDLRVIPCCFDFNASITLGDLRVQTLDEIFSSPVYERFIAAHKEDNLTPFPACAACERCRLP